MAQVPLPGTKFSHSTCRSSTNGVDNRATATSVEQTKGIYTLQPRRLEFNVLPRTHSKDYGVSGQLSFDSYLYALHTTHPPTPLLTTHHPPHQPTTYTYTHHPHVADAMSGPCGTTGAGAMPRAAPQGPLATSHVTATWRRPGSAAAE